MDERIDPRRLQNLEESRLSREQGHEFKNIFSIIIANAEMVGEELGITAPPVQRRLTRIIEACHRGEGLVQRIRNPANPEGKAAENQPVSAPLQVTRSGRVLVVDDETDVVEIIRRYLVKDGHQVEGVRESTLAWERLRADPFRYDLVITDLDMPLLSGADLSGKLRALRPELPVIMVTGYDRQITEEQTADLGIRELLLKPLDRNRLLLTVRRLLTP